MLIGRIISAFQAVGADIKAAAQALATHKGSADHDGRYYTKGQIDTRTVWTTETRPSPPAGRFGFNETLGAMEYFDGAQWQTVRHVYPIFGFSHQVGRHGFGQGSLRGSIID